MSGSIGGVDSSIPLQAGRGVPGPVNPLEALGQFAGIQNALNKAKLSPGELELQGQAIRGGNLTLAQKTRQAAYQALAPLLIGDTPITHDSVLSRLGAMEKSGLPTDAIVRDMSAASLGDGPQFHNFMRTNIASGMHGSSESALAATQPNTQLMNMGGYVMPGNFAPAGAPRPGVLSFPGGGATMTLSPGEQNAATEIPGPGGSRISVTGSGIAQQGGNQHLLPPGYTGRLPAALLPRNGNTPGLAPPTPASEIPSPPGVLGKTQTPAEQAGQVAQATAATTRYQEIAKEGNDAQQTAAVYGNMLNDASVFNSGPGTDMYKRAARALQAAGINIADPDKITSMDSMPRASESSKIHLNKMV